MYILIDFQIVGKEIGFQIYLLFGFGVYLVLEFVYEIFVFFIY